MIGALGAAALGAAAAGAGAAAGSSVGGALGAGIAGLSKSARDYRKQLRADTEKLESGKLGLTKAEKRAMLAEAYQQAGAQAAEANADMQRQAAASGGFGRTGSLVQAREQSNQIQNQARSAAGAEVNRLSTQKALSEKQRILGALKGQRDKVASDIIGATAGAGGAAKSAAMGSMSNSIGDGITAVG